MKNLLTLLPALFLPTLLHAEILFTEPFAYPDGPLVELAPDVWQNHSGAEAQTQILDNALLLSGTASEDINRAFSPVGLTSGIVHVAFDLITTRLPSAAGSYFFHFKDANSGPSSLFLGRLFASTTDATPGHFRISIAWGTGTPISIPRDLPTNSLHRIVLTLDLDQTNAVVRIDPLDEHSPVDSATSTDLRNAGVGMSRVAFRQATGIGNHQIRNLVVGTRFLDVTGTATPGSRPSQRRPRPGPDPPTSPSQALSSIQDTD